MSKVGDINSLNEKDQKLFEAWNKARASWNSCVEQLKKGELTQIEAFQICKSEIQNLYTETIYIKEPPKSSPEELVRQKDYRLFRKFLSEQKQGETKRKSKLDYALKRENIMCYKCQQFVDCISPEVELKQIRDSNRKKIIVKSICPNCHGECKAFGGYLL